MSTVLAARMPRLIDRGDARLARALDAVQPLSKIELHLHLDGSLRPATVSELARRYDPESRFAQPGWDVGYWTFSDLPGFLAQIDLPLRASLRSSEDWYRAAAECFADLAAQNVRYAEVSLAVRLANRPGYLPIADSLAAAEAARRACIEAVEVGFIVGVSRHSLALLGADGPETLRQTFETVIAARERGARVVGVDLHGDEASMPDVRSLAEPFALARQAGLGIRVHAGEAAGPESVWNALEWLCPARIGHGVRAAEDPALVGFLAERQIALDLCPTSNVLTGGAASIAAHPIRRLMEAGVPVTVSSDDPLGFETSIATELALLHAYAGFSLAELETLTATAARHAFTSANP